VRALAPVDRRPGRVAVEAPPKSLSLPEEAAKVTVPARRRGRPAKAAAQLELGTEQVAALTGGTDEAPKKRSRSKKVESAAIAEGEAAPKRGRAKKAEASATETAEKTKRARKTKAADATGDAKPARAKKTVAKAAGTATTRKPRAKKTGGEA
jgi:hypothetical protein